MHIQYAAVNEYFNKSYICKIIHVAFLKLDRLQKSLLIAANQRIMHICTLK